MKKKIFKNFLNQHKNSIFSYAIYLLHNKEDAEDVIQEVFIKLWKNWNRIQPGKHFSWIMKVTHNCCIDKIRKRKNFQFSDQPVDSLDMSNSNDYSNVILNPEKQYAIIEKQEMLYSALKKLPEKQKNILLMHYFLDMKIKTISETLDIKESTIKVTLFRSRKTLRTLLTDKFYKKIGGNYEFAV